jgi:hypothetical protein
LHSCSSPNIEEAGGEEETMVEEKIKGEEAEERWKK